MSLHQECVCVCTFVRKETAAVQQRFCGSVFECIDRRGTTRRSRVIRTAWLLLTRSVNSLQTLKGDTAAMDGGETTETSNRHVQRRNERLET